MMRQILVLSILLVLGVSCLMAQAAAPPVPPEPPAFAPVAPPPPPAVLELVPPEPPGEPFFQAPAPPAAPAPPPTPNVFTIMTGKGSYLGIGVQEVEAQRAKELKLPDVHGVEITRVEEDTPAAKAGLKQSDVVLEYNGQRVEGTEQFVRLVRETPAGREVKLLISRNGATQTITATVGDRKAAKRMVVERNFTMDPKWQQDMAKMQEELGRMRFELPDMPQVFMSYRSGALGVEAESVGSQLAEFFGVKKGVLVRSVRKESAAEKAGIKAGDVIVKVDNQEVSTPSQISKAIRESESKKTFPVTVVRNHQELTLNVTIENPPSGELGPRKIKTAPSAAPRPQAVRVLAPPTL